AGPEDPGRPPRPPAPSAAATGGAAASTLFALHLSFRRLLSFFTCWLRRQGTFDYVEPAQLADAGLIRVSPCGWGKHFSRIGAIRFDGMRGLPGPTPRVTFSSAKK